MLHATKLLRRFDCRTVLEQMERMEHLFRGIGKGAEIAKIRSFFFVFDGQVLARTAREPAPSVVLLSSG